MGKHKLGEFTYVYDELADGIDRQSWEVGSLDYPPTDPVGVLRFCRPWVKRDPRRHPIVKPLSHAALADNYREWQAKNHVRQVYSLKHDGTNPSSVRMPDRTDTSSGSARSDFR